MQKKTLETLNSYIEELKTIKKEKIYQRAKFIKGVPYRCTLANGKVIIREMLLKNNNQASASIILPVTEEGKLVVTVEPRVFTEKTVGIGFPAGYIEPGETPKQGAIRELKEETGYIAKEIIPLAKYYQDPGVGSDYNYAFLAIACKKATEQLLDSTEFIHYLEITYEEAKKLVQMGYITGLQSQFILEKAKPYIRKNKGEKI